MKSLFAVVFLILALVCGYGLLGSFEPGVAPAWKVGYGAGAVVCLLAAAVAARGKGGRAPPVAR